MAKIGENSLEIHGKIEKFYPYRTAIVQATVWIEIEGHVMWEMLNQYLERRGHHIDNHICWKLDNGMYFMYSDRKLGIGLSIIEGNW